MPEDTIASAAWRTCASVIPHPKLFQLFQPSGGVSAGLPGAASAVAPTEAVEAVEWAEAVTDAVSVSAAAARRRSSRLCMGTIGRQSGSCFASLRGQGHELVIMCAQVSAAG